MLLIEPCRSVSRATVDVIMRHKTAKQSLMCSIKQFCSTTYFSVLSFNVYYYYVLPTVVDPVLPLQ